MSIAENIKALRERYGLTQQQLGEIAGVSDKAVSTWETGANVPRMGAIQRMADHFGLSKSDIIEDSSERRPSEDLFQQEFNEVMLRRPQMRILFDAAKDAPDSVLQKTADLLEVLKNGLQNEQWRPACSRPRLLRTAGGSGHARQRCDRRG